MKYFTLLLLFLSPLCSRAQSADRAENAALLAEIERMDSLLFDVAFNSCDLELFKTILVDGLEFYDDRTGLNTDIKQEYASIADKCSQSVSVTRKLINHTVHKLGDYGAVQTGTHIFLTDGKAEGAAEFITIWERRGTSWIVKRAVSYEHRPL